MSTENRDAINACTHFINFLRHFNTLCILHGDIHFAAVVRSIVKLHFVLLLVFVIEIVSNDKVEDTVGHFTADNDNPRNAISGSKFSDCHFTNGRVGRTGVDIFLAT